MLSSTRRMWRLELFFKKQADLQSKRLPYLIEHDVQCVNLTNKTKDDRLLESVSNIYEAIPKADICVHYSIKWNYSGSEEHAMELLNKFLEELSQLKGAKSVLLLSGGGKKKKLDTIKALRRLKNQSDIPEVPIHVAFNPYFPADKDRADEQKRLKEKLATGLVEGIWLQTGSDLVKLEDGLKFLRKESSEEMKLYGSIFLPDKRLLAQMKYRPWNGVFLNDEYLSSVPKAMQITREILTCYQKYHVTPLLESALNTKQDMLAARDLLEAA